MQHRFQVGDRVIALDELVTGVPVGTLGTVVRIFVQLPVICDVEFDDHPGVRAVLASAIAPAPPTA
jgi:hypothetical protein